MYTSAIDVRTHKMYNIVNAHCMLMKKRYGYDALKHLQRPRKQSCEIKEIQFNFRHGGKSSKERQKAKKTDQRN
jgi:hypothetical protein